MTIYIVTLKSTGAEVYRYSHPEPVEWSGMEFSTHDHTALVEPPTPPSVAAQPVRITKLAFRNRFTSTEKVSIEIAALDIPTADIQSRSLSAALRANQQDLAVAQFIDLTRTDTRTGVQTLEAVGLLAPGRAAIILNTIPAEVEVFNG